MYWWDGWWPGAWLPMPFWFILVCLVMMAVFMLVIGGMHRMFMQGGHGRPRNSALDTLDDRFERGEIGQAEYNEKRAAITR